MQIQSYPIFILILHFQPFSRHKLNLQSPHSHPFPVPTSALKPSLHRRAFRIRNSTSISPPTLESYRSPDITPSVIIKPSRLRSHSAMDPPPVLVSVTNHSPGSFHRHENSILVLRSAGSPALAHRSRATPSTPKINQTRVRAQDCGMENVDEKKE